MYTSVEAPKSLTPDTLFEFPFVERPEPVDMVSLIAQGMSEADIIAAGQKVGCSGNNVDAVLGDLDTLLPYIQQQSDAISEQNPGDIALFAARDAELIFDDFAITHPKTTSYLLPASTDIWLANEMHGDLGKRFLARYGMTAQDLQDPENHYLLVDTGFRGTVGELLDQTLAKNYQIGLRAAGRLTVKLVCSDDYDALGPSIIDYKPGDVPRSEQQLPHTAAQLGPSTFLSEKHNQKSPPQTLLAIALQQLPRYQESFGGLYEHHGVVYARPYIPLTQKRKSYNCSLVDPIAAAIAQYRVVKSALVRGGILHQQD